MSRDANGVYTLPAGNPVVTNTVITTTWANSTMDDLATEVQDSLSRSGKGGMLAAFRAVDGTVSAPGLSFVNDVNTGIYRIGDDNIGISTAGVNRVDINASRMLVDTALEANSLALASALAIGQGGTGATTASAARTNLGLGASDSPTFAGLTVNGVTTADRLQTSGNSDTQISLISTSGYNTSVETSANVLRLRLNRASGATAPRFLIENNDTDLLDINAASNYARVLLPFEADQISSATGDTLVMNDSIAVTGYYNENTGIGYSTIAAIDKGVELVSGGMNSSSKYTPAVRFGSTDPQFSGPRPFLAGISGRATESYGSDATAGMALDFFINPNSSGLALEVAASLDEDGLSVTNGLSIGGDMSTSERLFDIRNQSNTGSQAFIGFDFNETTSDAIFRMFRGTNTAGASTFLVHNGDGTSGVQFRVSNGIASVNQIEAVSGDTVVMNDDFEVSGLLYSPPATSRPTISGGVLPAPSRNYVIFNPDGTTSPQNLNQISTTGIENGTVVHLRNFNDAVDVVAVDNANNLRLAGNFTFTSSSDILTLVHDSGNWFEVSRSDNRP